LEIHKPKPVHSWRELLNEVGVIVIGIAIALAGEQTIEWQHWHHEVAETREALDHEVAFNLGALQRRLDEAPCLDRRLGELRTYFAQRAQGSKARPAGSVGQPQFRRTHSNVWETAKAGQVASHFPLAERLRYAALYDSFDWARSRELEESVEWTRLLELDDFDSLGPEDWAALHAARARAKALADKVDFSIPGVIAEGRKGMVRPMDMGVGLSAGAEDLCKPLTWR
jgi:hypothetical protein